MGGALVNSSNINFINHHSAFRKESLGVSGWVENNFVLPYPLRKHQTNIFLTALVLT
jgi:hypothetical protein